ncbi:MAG: pilus assembly protein [Sphingomonadaceae bacterium]|nr:pilus assembly protein [Sphingomonadaceae bacterium]
MTRPLPLRALRRDSSGATIVEFALILPVLCMMLLGTLDLGYRSYVNSVVQGTLHDAARMATVGNVSTATIQTFVQNRLQAFSRNATITTTTRSYSDYSGVKVAETITQDTAPFGQYNPGDCFQDANGNGVYDTDRGRSGTGGSEDVVYFEVTMTYPHILPVGKLFGWNTNVTTTQNTVLRNQPYAGRTNSSTIVCT